MKSPQRDVAKIIECEGPRGGRILAHVLTCNHVVTRRQPATQVPCFMCVVVSQLDPVSARDVAQQAVDAALDAARVDGEARADALLAARPFLDLLPG